MDDLIQITVRQATITDRAQIRADVAHRPDVRIRNQMAGSARALSTVGEKCPSAVGIALQAGRQLRLLWRRIVRAVVGVRRPLVETGRAPRSPRIALLDRLAVDHLDDRLRGRNRTRLPGTRGHGRLDGGTGGHQHAGQDRDAQPSGRSDFSHDFFHCGRSWSRLVGFSRRVLLSGRADAPGRP